MLNVRVARVLCAFALMAGSSGLALAQSQSDPLEPLPEQTATQETDASPPVQADVLDAQDAEEARAAMIARFGVDSLEPGQFKWASAIPGSGATKVIVSLSDQLAFVYRGDELVGVSTVSSGMKDHETPTGVFPILAKEKDHRSKTYDDAPMPFMQRLNQFGVALHGGRIPGYPASHGCVRLPMAFAARLFTLTRPGTNVIIEA